MPFSVKFKNVGESDEDTACPIATSVPETDTPVPAVSVVIFADPSKLTPLIVLALANIVAVSASAIEIFALPSKEVPPIVLAVASLVAVAALHRCILITCSIYTS